MKVRDYGTLIDQICTALRNLGVDARVSEQVSGNSGRIEIAEGPIRRVDVEYDPPYPGRFFPDLPGTLEIQCILPDPRIGPDLRIGRTRARGFPSRGADFSSQDAVVAQGIMLDGNEINIQADPDNACWNLKAKQRREGFFQDVVTHWTGSPSFGQIWDCYQAIAQHLLATPVPVTPAPLSLEPLGTDLARIALRNLGVSARVLEAATNGVAGVWWPDSPGGYWPDEQYDRQPGYWIEIAEGPVRWVKGVSYPFTRVACLVPDSRIGPEFTLDHVDAREIPWATYEDIVPTLVRWLPVFGPVKDVRWKLGSVYLGYDSVLEVDYDPFDLPRRDFALGCRVAEGLSQDKAARERVISSGTYPTISAHPYRGCWSISCRISPPVQWTKPLWDCYQAIAQCLLALPMPAGE